MLDADWTKVYSLYWVKSVINIAQYLVMVAFVSGLNLGQNTTDLHKLIFTDNKWFFNALKREKHILKTL